VPVGNMNRRITFQTRAGGQTADGEPASGWTDYATVWASVKAVKGRNYYAMGQEQSEATHTILIRRRSDITAAMRIALGSRVFDIIPPVATDERTPFLVLSVTEQVP